MFGTVEIKVRPIKVAYLVDPRKPDQVREAIQLCSTLWGGVYSPIIPLYRQMPSSWKDSPLRRPRAKDVISGYLDAFDPDLLVQLAREVPAFVAGTDRRIIKPQEIWQPLEEHQQIAPRFGIGVFELFNDVFEKHFKYKAKYPVRVVIPKVPNQLSLFWASLFGELPSRVATVLEKHYFEPLDIHTIDFDADKLAEVMKADVFFPRRVTQLDLDVIGRRRVRGDAAVYFLDATKVEDIVDFWNLRAIGMEVLPLPKQLKDHPQLRTLLTAFLKRHRRHWQHQPTVCDVATIVRSRNSTMAELQEFARGLEIARPKDDPSSDGFYVLQHWYPRVWDEWARDKDGAMPRDTYATKQESIDFSDPKELRIRFKPLLPDFAAEYSLHSELRCANEFSFRTYGSTEYFAEVFPRASGHQFRRAISGITSSADWRAGRHGLVRLVNHAYAETREIPSAERIFFAWLRDLGWAAELSAPGILAKQIYRQVEGHPWLLMQPRVLGLLERMNGGRVASDDSPSREEQVHQERDLDVGEIKTRLKQISTRGDLYQYLVSKGIFRLGLRTACPQCSRHSWFPLDGIGNKLTCPRCLNDFPAVGNLDQSTWSYKTTGPFSVAHYADGAYAVLLTLHCFDDSKMTTMRTTPVLSFTAKKGDDKLEADFALFWQESLFGEQREGLAFGECKSYGTFAERDFKRMRYIAKTFPGAVLVFSTLRDSLTKPEIAAMRRIAKAGRKYWKADRPINPVLVLTGTELFSWEDAPHCWSESLRQRFPHILGLLRLCDATQQIYLKLPSWEVEWHEKREKRRRSQAKQSEPAAAAETLTTQAPASPQRQDS